MSYPEEPQPPSYQTVEESVPVSGPAAGWPPQPSEWSPPGGVPRDPPTVRPVFLEDRTPPYAQAPVRLRPAYPVPRTLPMPPPTPGPTPGNALVPVYHPQVPFYGYPVQSVFPAAYAPPPVAQNSGLCVASMVLGILGLVFLCCDFGVLSLIAVILGHLGMSQARATGRAGRGFGIAGLVLGYTVLVPAFGVSVVVVLGNALNGLH